jgi:hypothetical protein
MVEKSTSIRNYYRKDGCVFVVDHAIKTVSVPQSVEEDNYPDEVKAYLTEKNYYKQLTIE